MKKLKIFYVLSAFTLSALLVVVFMPKVGNVTASSFSLGNDATGRSQLDSRSNFTVLDTNNPSAMEGQITGFSYYATNTNSFRFVLVDNADMVKWVSDEITPATAPGANTYTPSSPVDVSVDDNIALYFASTGTIPYEVTGADAYYTVQDSGLPVVDTTLTYESSEGRTYSFVAYGNTVTPPPPPPPSPPPLVEEVSFPGFAYGQIAYMAGDLERSISFFASSNRNTRPYFGNGLLIYQDENEDWYNVDVRYVAVIGDDAYLAGRVKDASNDDWKNQWLYLKVHDGGASGDQVSGELVRGTQALLHFVRNDNLTDPSSGPFDVTSGDLMVIPALSFIE
ncbi:MAG: hypothetical protein Q8Q48_02365 [Candidatus Staskawiczbacteria bacterium]|nr:hypothetical protein [Candidatus Staskawiczbacteria bacterium]